MGLIANKVLGSRKGGAKKPIEKPEPVTDGLSNRVRKEE